VLPTSMPSELHGFRERTTRFLIQYQTLHSLPAKNKQKVQHKKKNKSQYQMAHNNYIRQVAFTNSFDFKYKILICTRVKTFALK
jgi:hypothetical protein